MSAILQSVLGLAALVLVAWLLSEAKRQVRSRPIIVGVVLQIAIAALCLNIPVVATAIGSMSEVVNALSRATEAGTSLIFGYLGGAPLPFEERQPGASFILAFRALPLIIFLSALTAVLTYWRVLPWIIQGFAAVLRRVLGLGGAVGFASAANIFVGMVEAPLFIRPYLSQMTRSELFMVMTVGMATVAGTVLILYATILSPVLPDAAGHLVVASVISIPAAVVVSLIMVPRATGREDKAPDGAPRDIPVSVTTAGESAMDALSNGTQRGLSLYLNVIAMLLVLVACVQLINLMLGLLPDVAGHPISLERLASFIFAPLAWLIGIPWGEQVHTAATLLAKKTILNEFLAYLDFAQLPAGALSERSAIILTYALCGFANPGSVGILTAGFLTLLPERRSEILSLAPRTLISGTLATLMTGAVVGLLTT
ncbi:MAG: nucleoside transporter C-terminal domain-containing protein [Pseudomonadota bacterium]